MTADPRDWHRVVIKIGSALLVNEQGNIDRDWLDGIAADVAWLKQQKIDVLVVSSGAIAVGSRWLGIDKRRARLENLQAAAASGQVELAFAYREAFFAEGLKTAQVLLTPGDTEDRRRFLNARRTLSCLLDYDVVPIINENDTVATDEIRYGDNDRLAARVAQLVMADRLVLLSDVDGLYNADPRVNADAEHVAEIEQIDDEVLSMAGETRSALGSGGMATKVAAARIATHAGCSTIICDGRSARPLRALANGGRHSLFRAARSPAASRKQWLAGLLQVGGELRLDEGASRALRDGNSLLPIGVVGVVGAFQRGDVVTLVDSSGAEIGRGLSEYSDHEARRLAGVHSDDIQSVLGYRGRSVLVHRDEIIIFESQ